MRKARQVRAAAAALHYDPVKSEPPELVAVGRGFIAEEIMRIARENKIPIHADRGLVEALAQLDAGSFIPRELYTVVAEVLAWVYRLDAESAGDPGETAKSVN
ncbi:MAG: EscU/YscU/HrcU family type III secretion system export apparatus switch protein [Candidatus Eremiobacteraeota bacterium]|nr:EscU/YscU/HrcU family type III secretion system export apparatus switch protein [Candidatus Eremiobacteraeota bacterium]MBV8355404.1 EscU/YscU/HrcU family type III secretion system export apparatus switch protein [Candidatus Eremiobacteraeota bacterium]